MRVLVRGGLRHEAGPEVKLCVGETNFHLELVNCLVITSYLVSG